MSNDFPSPPPDQAPAPETIHGLIKQWRGFADLFNPHADVRPDVAADTFRQCADELEALLRAVPLASPPEGRWQPIVRSLANKMRNHAALAADSYDYGNFPDEDMRTHVSVATLRGWAKQLDAALETQDPALPTPPEGSAP